MSLTDHITVEPELQLPPEFADVPGLLELHDPDLRLRRSVDRPELYVLERRCRRAPAVNIGMHIRSDLHVQARDGYIHVATTNAAWLFKPWNLLRALKTEGADLWAEGGAAKWADEQEYEEHWLKESRKRRRLGLYRDIASEGYDLLNRMPGQRSRINNAGVRAHGTS
jgi:hypothetical protein